MSEYQYYEFLALDRPLTEEQRAELRSISTRAEITATRFVNEYQWGDLKGDPRTMVERYFDAFLYLANWGTRRLMFRLPRGVLDSETAGQYCCTDTASLIETGSHLILSLYVDREPDDYWEEPGGQLAAMVQARSELAAGDLRLLYLAWLLAIQWDEVDDGDTEPPVPAGLGNLSAPLQAIVDFLEIDEDLIAVAAASSPSVQEEGTCTTSAGTSSGDRPPGPRSAGRSVPESLVAMTETTAALLAGLPGDVRALLARPPLTDTRLLELAATWEGLMPAQARMAEALRLFVVTWDPLEWLAPRPEAVATVNAWPVEIVIYVPVWSLAEMARRRETTMAAVLAGLGGRAITTAAAHEDAVTSGRYAELAAHGEVPALLSGNPGPALEKAVIMAESAEWEDIGLGAITDFVQQAFGPVELDRSLVELTVTAAPQPGCPACAGRRFKFPADLADSRDRMCPPHRKEADAVIRRRIGRAEASNPAGWQMLADASARLSLPHLPGGLATRLAAAEKDLVRRARLLAEAAAGFAGRPDDFGSALAENRDQAGRFPGWPVTLIGDLGRAGQGTEAVMLSEALAVVDPARHGFFAGEAAVALAEAGLADDARAKIAENLERWPDDIRARILAGDALATLDDLEAALAHFQMALPLAQQAKDYKAIRDLSTRIFRLTRPATGETVQRRQPRSRSTRSQRKGRR